MALHPERLSPETGARFRAEATVFLNDVRRRAARVSGRYLFLARHGPVSLFIRRFNENPPLSTFLPQLSP
jgi:hypothetical protein